MLEFRATEGRRVPYGERLVLMQERVSEAGVFPERRCSRTTPGDAGVSPWVKWGYRFAWRLSGSWEPVVWDRLPRRDVGHELADGRPDPGIAVPMRMPIGSAWFGLGPNSNDPQSPQNHFSPPSSGLHTGVCPGRRRSESVLAGDDPKGIGCRVGVRRRRRSAFDAGTACSGNSLRSLAARSPQTTRPRSCSHR